MASVYAHLIEKLRKLTIQRPVGMPESAALELIADKALPKLVLEAFSGGVRPTLTDWIEMPASEQALWQKYIEEEKVAKQAMLATMLGNTAMARLLLHGEDEQAQRMELLQSGLDTMSKEKRP